MIRMNDTELRWLGYTREEMLFDKEKLLRIFDLTKGYKPRKGPKITGYPKPADQRGTSTFEGL